MNGPFCLIINPTAGRGRARRVLHAATGLLDDADVSYEVAESASLDHARDLAARAGQAGQVIVAVGGDGMAGALAGVAARHGARYGIIPAGNGNDLARGLGIPFETKPAVAVLTAGRERQVDLIAVEAGDKADTIVAGSVYIGVPSVAGEIANRMQWLRGPALYPVAALQALARWAPARFGVQISGRDEALEFSGYAVVVANGPYFGAGMKVAPQAVTDDGVLDVMVMHHAAKLTFLRVLTKVRDGSHLGLPQISAETGTEVTITADRDLPAAADGETLSCAAPLRAGTPLRLRALPAALRAIVPG
jgi:diacylglycerol kinase (ATP)